MNDLGSLHYFLGLEITYATAGIMVHQAKYNKDVLQRFGTLGAKPSSTPLALVAADLGTHCYVDYAKNYRALIEVLHYLTFSRPDIMFAVRKLSQHIHMPYSSHLATAKRVLHYLGGTVGLGFLFRKGSVDLIRLQAYIF
ncbi:uncharacterized protein LOC111021713 [Momordica charantia]|uniref:Uncharacterized protein LOC111021713 n=1 Tax=Momordica charantia TaxID=3673 RepID=A0A6J1DNQ9_MOMCH|nr:uncharacterized protein LOC111021713 [Momordica charantia]